MKRKRKKERIKKKNRTGFNSSDGYGSGFDEIFQTQIIDTFGG
jgi:hypothetical protein